MNRQPLTNERSLAELHSCILIGLSNALSFVRVFQVAAPFCDPGLALIEADLERALNAAHEARALEVELARIISGPTRPIREGERR